MIDAWGMARAHFDMLPLPVGVRTACTALVLGITLAGPAGVRAQGVPTAPDNLRRDLAGELARPVLPVLGDGQRQDVALRVTGAVPPVVLDGIRDALREALTPRVRRLIVLSAGEDLPRAVESARAEDADVLVFVQVISTVARLTAQAETVRVQPGAWASFELSTLPPPEPLGAATAAVPLDPATRAMLGAVRPARWPLVPASRPRRIDTPFHGTVALALGDLDGDGRDELVLAAPDRVRIARLAGASLAFATDTGGGWLGALGWTPVPLRQPVGSLAYDAGSHRVLLRTSAQTGMGAVSLSAGAVTVTALPAADLYPAAGYGCVVLAPGGVTVTALVPDCGRAIGSPGPRASLTLANGAVAAVPVALAWADASGRTRRVEALADGVGGCELRVDGQRVAVLTDVAPPLALADLDGDGRVEVLAAGAGNPWAPDRLRVFTLTATGAEERPGLAVPGPVEGIAVGDVDGDGLPEAVVAAQDPQRRATTLWILP